MIGSGSVAGLCHEPDDLHLKLLVVAIELIVIILTLSMITKCTIMHTLYSQ